MGVNATDSGSQHEIQGPDDTNVMGVIVTVQEEGSNSYIAETAEDTSEVLGDFHLRKRGRELSDVWTSFTRSPNPSQLKSAVCMHCNCRVNHHRKSECAATHLNRCASFRQVMNGIEDAERPRWYERKKKSKTSTSETVSLSASTSKSQSTTSKSALPRVAGRQSNMKEYTLPKMSPRAVQMFRENMAMHYYATGSAFQRIEDVHLKAAIKCLRPDQNLLPSRKLLAGALLTKCHKQLTTKVKARLNGATFCLTTDGWSNIKNDPIVNYMAVSPEVSLFLESVATGQQGHTHTFIANDITRVIESNGDTVFAGAVTDNTAANKKAWSLLEERFPSFYFQGCCSHGIHLLVKDVFAATKTKKPGDEERTFPIGYPFAQLLTFVSRCKQIVRFFCSHHSPKAQLRELQRASNCRALVNPAPTRWGTIQQMCQSLLDSEQHLHTIVNQRDFLTKGGASQKSDRTQIKEFVSDALFLVDLKKSIAILTPLDALIVKYQSDSVPISEVIPDFNKLPKQFETLRALGTINPAECSYLNNLAVSRLKFMYGKGHGMAYLLDPQMLGDELPIQEKSNLEMELFLTTKDNVTPTNEERQEQLFVEYTNFVITATNERRQSSFRYKMLKKKRITVLQYWLTEGKAWPELSMIAVRLFSMVTSSAASERNFSTMANIHTKNRNRLNFATFEKLVYVKSNISAFFDNATDAADWDDSEKDDDDDDMVEYGRGDEDEQSKASSDGGTPKRDDTTHENAPVETTQV